MTITVGKADRYAGNGSKETTITGSGVILTVESNLTEQGKRSPIIENLIIDGQNQSGTTGLFLQNVAHTLVRNITIKNCDTGIHFNNHLGGWVELTSLKHIRMENVKTGILFNTDGYYHADAPGNSFGHSYIDDVGIRLRNDSNAVGILVGDGQDPEEGATATNADPYNSFIKANIWLGSSGGCGLRLLNGELKYDLVNIGVQGSGTGIGIDLSNATADASQGQSPIEKNIHSNTGNPTTDIKGFLFYADGLAQSIKNTKNYTTDITQVPPP